VAEPSEPIKLKVLSMRITRGVLSASQVASLDRSAALYDVQLLRRKDLLVDVLGSSSRGRSTTGHTSGEAVRGTFDLGGNQARAQEKPNKS
jgi:hypothetical protein